MKHLSFIAILLLFYSCKKDNNSPALSSQKSVSGVVFRTSDNPSLSADITATIAGDSIKTQVIQGASVNALVPYFTYTGRSISPANQTPQNFSSTLTYTITAEDGSTKNYFFRVARVDSITMLSGHWRVIKDSVFDTPGYVNPGGGHPTPGTYIGTPADYWDFYSTLEVHENGNTFPGIAYAVLANNKLSVDGLDIYYDPATIELLSPASAVFSWSKTLPNGERYFRRIFLGR